jgi:hypothetical protein
LHLDMTTLQKHIKCKHLFLDICDMYSVLYHLYLLPSRFLSKNLELKIYKTNCICYIWVQYFTRQKHSLRVFRNRLLGRIFGGKRDEVTEQRNLDKEECHNLYYSPSIIRVIISKDDGIGGAWEVHTKFWLEVLKGRDNFGDQGISTSVHVYKIIFVLMNSVWSCGTGFIWLRIRSSGGLVWTAKWAVGFHKRQRISWKSKKRDSYFLKVSAFPTLLCSSETLGFAKKDGCRIQTAEIRFLRGFNMCSYLFG